MQSRLEARPPRSVWLPVEDVQGRFDAGETLFSPIALQLVRALAGTASLEGAAAQMQTPAIVGLETELLYAPRLALVPLHSDTIPPFTKTNLVVLRSGSECLLVDPAAAGQSVPEFAALMESLRACARVVCVLTHHHHDHVAGLAQLQRFFPQATVLAHPLCLRRIPATSLATRPVEVSGGRAILF